MNQTTAVQEQGFNQAFVEVMQVRLGDEVILIPVPDVAEIVHTQTLTPVPMAPDHLLGLCNIHGQIICVIDPCRVMSLSSSKHARQPQLARFIVLHHPKMHLAIYAEEILSLLQINEDEFQKFTRETDGFFYAQHDKLPQQQRLLHTETLFK